MINEYILKKSDTELNLCKEIIENATLIKDDLSEILNEENGYMYNKNPEKLKKHFSAAINMSYTNFIIYLTKQIDSGCTISFSLSSKPVLEQIKGFLDSAIQRFNLVNMYNDNKLLTDCVVRQNMTGVKILTPLDLSHYLVKYDNEESIKNKFPHFTRADATQMFDVIYSIKTENPDLYMDAKNKTICDTILVCCDSKTFNIMFELDKDNPYYINIIEEYPDSFMEMYKDKHI